MKIRSYIKDKFVDFILWFLMILIIELFLIMFKVVNSDYCCFNNFDNIYDHYS